MGDLTLCMLGTCQTVLSTADFFFFKTSVFKNSLRNAIKVSNSLDPDQARQYVGPGLGPDCLQALTKVDTSR